MVLGDILNHPLSPLPLACRTCPTLPFFLQAEEAGESLGVSDRLGAFLRAFAVDDVGYDGFFQVGTPLLKVVFLLG